MWRYPYGVSTGQALAVSTKREQTPQYPHYETASQLPDSAGLVHNQPQACRPAIADVFFGDNEHQYAVVWLAEWPWEGAFKVHRVFESREDAENFIKGIEGHGPSK